MSTHVCVPTFSQALLNLGRIRKIEDPINFGLLGLYKALEYRRVQEGERMKMNLYLKRFKEFCDRLEMIVSFEQKQDYDSLKSWLVQKPEEEITLRIDSFLGIYSFFLDQTERLEQAKNLKTISETVGNILEGRIDIAEVKAAIKKLEALREDMVKKLGTEKRLFEKIVSG